VGILAGKFRICFYNASGQNFPVTSSYHPATEHYWASIRRPKGIKNAASLHAHIHFKDIRAQREPPCEPAPAGRSGETDPLGRNDPRIQKPGLDVGALTAG
jgi:hypothetical protein